MESQKNNLNDSAAFNEKTSYKSNCKKHFVYKWTNVITKEYYIGKHSGTEDDGYTGSGKLFKLKYNKDPVNWHREILDYCPSSKSALYSEKNFIGDLYKIDPKCLNLVPGGINDAKLTEHHAKELITKKTKEQIVTTFCNWLGVKVFFAFVYSAKNANGHHTVINTTPNALKDFLDYLQSNDNKQYSYDMLDKFFVLNNLSIELIPNYAEILESKEEYDSLKDAVNHFSNLLLNYRSTIDDRKEKIK